jgi:hypothetical protein
LPCSGKPFARLLRENAFGIQLSEIFGELRGREPAALLPQKPLRSMSCRHTVGLTDPLTDDEITPQERVEDGLPQSLASYLRVDGLTHLKIKLGGDLEADRERLHRIADVLVANGSRCAFTLDGNENFQQVAPFQQLWESFLRDPVIARLLEQLIFVEQPLHRNVALSPKAGGELLAWTDRPPIIIDESDAQLGDLALALQRGYAGASHKNCKGVFKGLANAALIAQRRADDRSRALHLSAEDLSNIGPVALLQDLAVVATLGISHAERNGHHYFAGLSQFPAEVQRQVQHAHADLFQPHRGYPAVKLNQGKLSISSVVDAPFGTGFDLDLSLTTRIEGWPKLQNLSALALDAGP